VALTLSIGSEDQRSEGGESETVEGGE